MAGLIPESFIDDLLARVDIVEVVERRVPLKKSGHEWTACCPFHNERTPSFTVSPQKQFYHCFGCGAHGSAITFLMEYEHLEFPDAIEELAQGLGLSVPHEGGDAPRKSNQGLYALMDEVAAHYRKALAGNREARDYCLQRGLDDETLQRFGIGWAAASGLIRSLGHSPERMAMLEQAGMIARGDSGPYERFRRRLMIPIRDRRGRVIAFGGRLLEGEGAKYLNSPETPLFHKGRELFGLWEVKQANTRLDRIVVVEGYMDAIALHQAGCRSPWPRWARRPPASTPNACSVPPATSSSLSMATVPGARRRGGHWKTFCPSSVTVVRPGFCFCPTARTPTAWFAPRAAKASNKRIAEAMPLSRYFFAELERDVDIGSIDGRARLVSKAQPLLEKLPAGSFRQLMLRELEKHSGASVRLAPNGSGASAPATAGTTTRQSGTQHDCPAPAPADPGQRTALGPATEIAAAARHRPARRPAAARAPARRHDYRDADPALRGPSAQ